VKVVDSAMPVTIPGKVIADSDIVIADSGVIAWTPGRPPHRSPAATR
jgi:hypothetical protein